MGFLKIGVVVAVVIGLTANLWSGRTWRKSEGALARAVRGRSAAYGDALVLQCVVLVAAVLLDAGTAVVGVALAALLLSALSFWLRMRTVRA